MSKTIRVDDRLYEALDSYRGDNESFSEVVENLARKAGIYSCSPTRLDQLRTKLENEFNLSQYQIQEILYALRDVYTGTPDTTTFGPGRDEIHQSRYDELEILKRLGLIEEEKSTHLHSPHYTTTESGNAIGSEAVGEFLEAKRSELNSLLDKYGRSKMAFLLAFGFEPTCNNRLSTSLAELGREEGDEWWHDDIALLEEYEALIQDLQELEIAIKRHTSSGENVHLPPQLDDELATIDRGFETKIKKMEAYRILKQYSEDNISSSGLDKILRKLQVADETSLKETVNRLNDEGITSRYSGGETPFFVLDRAALLSHIEHQARDCTEGDR